MSARTHPQEAEHVHYGVCVLEGQEKTLQEMGPRFGIQAEHADPLRSLSVKGEFQHARSKRQKQGRLTMPSMYKVMRVRKEGERTPDDGGSRFSRSVGVLSRHMRVVYKGGEATAEQRKVRSGKVKRMGRRSNQGPAACELLRYPNGRGVGRHDGRSGRRGVLSGLEMV